MEKQVLEIYRILQKLIGFHRQLMEVVRSEHDALVQANLKGIQDTTCAKEGLIESIRQHESERLKLTAELASIWKKPFNDLTLSNLIIEVQGKDLKTADQIRSSLTALTTLIQRISEQNRQNKLLVEKSLEHVASMKRNVLGEAAPHTSTYTQQGQKTYGSAGSRLISTEV